MEARITEIVSGATNAEIGKISLATHFTNDLEMDSLDTVELMMKMEDEFGIEISEEDAGQLETVGHVVEFLKDKTTLN
jgi:acyl carrier protein